MQTTLIENGEASASGQYHAMGPAGSMGAQSGSEQGCQCDSAQSSKTVRIGSKTISYEDLLMLLVALQTVALLLDLYGEVSG